MDLRGVVVVVYFNRPSLCVCGPVKSAGFPRGPGHPGLLRLREEREPGSQLPPQPGTGRRLNGGGAERSAASPLPPSPPLPPSSAQHKDCTPQILLYNLSSRRQEEGERFQGGREGGGNGGEGGWGGGGDFQSTEGCVQILSVRGK